MLCVHLVHVLLAQLLQLVRGLPQQLRRERLHLRQFPQQHSAGVREAVTVFGVDVPLELGLHDLPQLRGVTHRRLLRLQ